MRFIVPLIWISLFALSASATEIDRAALADDVTALRAQVSSAEAEVDEYEEGSAIWALGQMRVESLKTTLAALEGRLRALEHDVPTEIRAPAVAPDPEKAAEILAKILEQQQKVTEAEAQAEATGGLVKAIARMTALSERMALGILRIAYYQAAYGIAYPAPPKVTESAEPAVGQRSDPPSKTDHQVADAPPPWADPAHPEIDYRAPIFEAFRDEGEEFVGWWQLRHGKSQVDDAAELTAVNLSGPKPSFGGLKTLIARCVEHRLAVIYLGDEFLIGDFMSDRLPVLVRVDDKEARKESWTKLTSNKGAGLFGASSALPLMREMASADKAFLRIDDGRGSRTQQLFQLAGADKALERVANTCGETLVALDRDGYRAVQNLLVGAGYLTGPADGAWGPASKAAMKRFQSDKGLTPTGAPDGQTLQALGLGSDAG